MKTVAKRILTLIVVFCMACVGLVCTPITGAKAANVDYVETEFGEGKLLITTTYNGNTYYLPTTTTSSAPTAKKFTNVSEISEDNLWTVTASGNNYYIQNSGGSYLYTTASNSGVRVGTTKVTWVYNSTENSLKDTGKSRYLGIYNAQDWRCYTTHHDNYKGSSKAFKFYTVKEVAAAPTEITDALNEVDSYMSLAYKYTANTEVVETVGVTDKLNLGFTGVSAGTNYETWSNKTGTSGAVYAGNSAGDKSSIQLRSNNSNSGIVTTKSAGIATKITVEWNSETADGRTLDIYGKNTAYTAATDLYDSNAGTKLGSIKKGTSTELTISGDYEYIGLRSNSGAMYLTSISIEWNGQGGTQEVTTFSDAQFKIRCAVDATLFDIDGVDKAGICVTAGTKAMYYTADNASSWTDNGDVVYVVINLGDVLTEIEKASTQFTVYAYVQIGENKYASEKTKTYSIASLVKYYAESELGYGEEVAHLYEYLQSKGLI